MSREYSRQLAQIALGKHKAQLVFKNAQVIQVFTNEILTADIAVQDGIIIGVGRYQGEAEIDLSGKYVCPGFIDAHLHLESTLVNPGELILQAGLTGTTTFIVDPHEAANVAGTAGIDYILSETEDTEANVYVMIPSCVPSGPNEDNGHHLTIAEMRQYLEHPRVLGLGEVMDCQAVLDGEDQMLEKLRLFGSKKLDGHAGYLGEKETGCYALSGIQTDHECCTYEDALREMRTGMQILIREGTGAKNLEGILTGIIDNQIPCHQLAFCTDDKHIEDIREQGHISYNVRRAIELGMPPIEAIKIATLYPAKCYGLKHLGAIAPGYQADLLVFSDMEEIKVEAVYYKGKRLDPTKHRHRNIPAELRDTVHIKWKGREELRLFLQGTESPVIELVPGQILTRNIRERVNVQQGEFIADQVYQKLVVLERHHGTGKKEMGIVKGFFLQNGAIASTVAHDSHNLIAVGDNDEDMCRAIEALIKCGGGYVVVESGKEPLILPLEIMGLISTWDYEQVSKMTRQMLVVAHKMGVPADVDPFITLSFLSLPVIPQVRLTTRGLYDVMKGNFII